PRLTPHTPTPVTPTLSLHDALPIFLDEHRGEDPSLAARLERITAETALLRDAAEAVERARLAEQERERAAAEAEAAAAEAGFRGDRKSTRLNSSHVKISYAVFCLKK